RRENLPVIQHVDLEGRIKPGYGAYSNRLFHDPALQKEILRDLSEKRALVDTTTIKHAYPHCWRCKTPLMYYARPSWFLKTTEFKDAMIEANKGVNWLPDHIKEGRFGKWLENNVDWPISRDRYWGSPLNIWSHEKDPSNILCPSSIRELNEKGAILKS